VSSRNGIRARLGLAVPSGEPVTEVQRRQHAGARRQTRFLVLLATSTALGLAMIAAVAWTTVQMLWLYGGRSYPHIEAHFRHGSIGAELANGMPLRMLKALPRVFPDYFGKEGDWSHFGLILASGADGDGRLRYDVYEAGSAKGGRLRLTSNDAPLEPDALEKAGLVAKAEMARRADIRLRAERLQAQSRGLPIGFATGNRLGIEMAWFNCAVCHTGVVQMPDEPRPRIVPGMPANTVDLERLFLALFGMAVDKRFTYREFARHFEKGEELGVLEAPFWEWLIVPNVRAELIARRSELLPLLDPARAPPMTRDPRDPSQPAWCEPRLKPRPGCSEAIYLKSEPPYRRERPRSATRWGPGRVDTFNPYKLINFEMEADCLRPEERIGVSDFPTIYLQGPRADKGMHLHWDGNNASIAERNLSAALGAGVSESTVDHASLQRLVTWLRTLEPPESPYAARQDPDSVRRGRVVYRAVCESCHGYQDTDGKGYVLQGAELGKVEPLAYVGTDRGRVDSYTPLMEKYQKDRLFCAEPEHRFRQFKKTDGYANMPLDGLWLRAPYLHNGSVPTLWDLLQRPEDRPLAFRRGAAHVRLDPVKGGFEAPPCIPTRGDGGDAQSFCFDTELPGNSSGGHLYGTDLPEAQKRDLLAYLLTF
jgi:mono/diheme cytochrome c family protein